MTTATLTVDLQDVVGDRGLVILGGIVGSTAYGLARDGSDIDHLGVYVAPTEQLLGVHALNIARATATSTCPDVTVHEAGKFAALALQCNPTLLELLWLPANGYVIVDGPGRQLVELRDRFLHRQGVKNAYLGYADQQLARLLKRGRFPDIPVSRIAKHARHLLRLLDQGAELWETGRLTVRVADPDRYFDFAARVTANPHNAIAAFREAEDRFERPGGLPCRPDEDAVNDWLLALRRAQLLYPA